MASTSSNRCSAESVEHCDQPARVLMIGRCPEVIPNRLFDNKSPSQGLRSKLL